MARAITSADLYRFELITELRMAPDGAALVYVQKETDEKTHKAWSNLWLVRLPDGQPQRFTAGRQSDAMPRWSPDGRRIAFLSKRGEDKRPQVYIIPRDGGEAQRLTALQGALAGLCWSPDGSRLAAVYRAEDAETLAREEDPAQEKLGVVARHTTRTFFKLDGDGFLPRARWRLVVIDAVSGAMELISDPRRDASHPSWAPDGASLVFVSNQQENPDLAPEHEDVFVVEARPGARARALGTPVGYKFGPRFSPDGERIAYIGQAGVEWWRKQSVFVVPRGGGEVRDLTAAFDVTAEPLTLNDTVGLPEAEAPQWSPDGARLFFPLSRDGQTLLASVTTGETPALSEVLEQPGCLTLASCDTARQRTAVRVASFEVPCQVALVEDGALRTLTRTNAWLAERALGAVEELRFEGAARNPLQGWLLKPPGYDPARRHPLILEIHGGPLLQYGDEFMHEFRVLSARGYLVAFCNPRGGQGYGEAHARAIYGGWGRGDHDDLMAFTDRLVERPDVDPARLGVTGGSYGGYMTCWIVGHTDRFAAAVTQRCVSNLVSMMGTSDFNWVFQRAFGDQPVEENLEHLWDRSPLKYIAAVRTPTLVIHSEQDHRCPVEQAEQFYVGLKRHGVDAALLRFPDESHGLSRGGRADRRVRRLDALVGWFERYLGRP